jgi:hypothetical protein
MTKKKTDELIRIDLIEKLFEDSNPALWLRPSRTGYYFESFAHSPPFDSTISRQV